MPQYNSALIFGAAGQDGTILGSLLKPCCKKIYKTARSKDYIHVDVSNAESVNNIISKTQPDLIFHLAATSCINHESIQQNQHSIVQGALNIFQSVESLKLNAKIFLASSGLVFENNNDTICETDYFTPSSAYSVARIQSIYLSRYYRERGLKIYTGHLFHHDSILRPPTSAARSIANKMIDIWNGESRTISVQNQYYVKEWAWAPDIVDGILRFIAQDKIFESCIGLGIGHSVEEYIHECAKVLQLKNFHTNQIISKKPFMASFVSNPKLIHSVGWAPTVNFQCFAKQIIADELYRRGIAYKALKNSEWA